MKQKLVMACAAFTAAVPAIGFAPPPVNIPEPSSLGLFVAAALALVVVTSLKK